MNDHLVPWPETQSPWTGAAHDPGRGGPEFGDLIAAERDLLRVLSGAAPPPAVMAGVASRLADLAVELTPYLAAEADRYDGVRLDLPGRGMASLPPFVVDVDGDERIGGRVTFSRFYLGGNGAVHGGALPLLFDDVLGHLANRSAGRARTAYLTVNYRRITPIEVELTWEARMDRVDGRKRFVVGTLRDAEGHVLAEADGLFIALKPGQP